MRIEPMTLEHAKAALSIYQDGIDDGDATFETAGPFWADFDAAKLPDHRFVALDDADRSQGGSQPSRFRIAASTRAWSITRCMSHAQLAASASDADCWAR